MTHCAFIVCAHDRSCHAPATHQAVYELFEEPGMESTDYRHYCRAHAERYAEHLLASGVVKTARAVELEAANV